MQSSGRRAAAAAVLALAFLAPAAGAVERAEVDPFIGTVHGDTALSAQIPFGFAAPGPDTPSPGTASAGYRPDEEIIGFSQTRNSGTGSPGRYGNFRVAPLLGEPRLDPVTSPKAAEHAEPGYYRVLLTRHGIRARLTAARLASLLEFRFPAKKRAQVVVDVTSRIEDPGPHSQRPRDASVRATGPRTVEGSVTMRGGWGGGGYRLHFAAEFSRTPSGVRILGANGASASKGARTRGEPLGLAATFDTRRGKKVAVKLGLSFVSGERAARNLRKQIRGFDFERARTAATGAWGDALARVKVSGGSFAERQAFATALYHSHLMPHDLTGENAWWESDEPHYEDFFTLWDTFRTLHPLLTVLQPGRQRDMVRSLVDTYRHTGWMPDARVAGNNSLVQVGTSGDVVVADALVKGLGGIDYPTAYAALLKNADVPTTHDFHGRRLEGYLQLGYVPLEQRASVSRTVEYAYADFAIGEVAKRLGDPATAQRMYERSRNWANLWDPATESLRPRDSSGRFLEPFSPWFAYYGWDDPYYEGTGWQYASFVPHDVQGLIDRLGGDAAFVRWLDRLMQVGFDPGNEPALLAPYLYAHAGRPDRGSAEVRRLLASAYGTGPSGLPGGDDGGALSSWYAWGAMGLFPNAGQPYYYVVAPLFTSVRIELEGGRALTVEAPAASPENRYVTAATLNGRALERAFITHDELAAGGTLRLELASTPSGWGAAERPFSLPRR